MEQRRKKYLAISTISLLGSCETKVYDALFGKQVVTSAMRSGAASHDRMVKYLPKISKAQMMNEIKSGKWCSFREVTVFDSKLGMVGRMDEIDFGIGYFDGRRLATLVDDKFTRAAYNEIPAYYKLQLACYSKAVENSDDFSKLCTVGKAILRCRDRSSKEITNELGVDRSTLKVWLRNVPAAVRSSWDIYNEVRKAEHRRFDVGRGEWIRCYCGE